MPAWVLTSPAVVMVRMPVTKVGASFGIGGGSQRNWPSGRSCSSSAGAVFQYGSSIRRTAAVCRTEGRMR